MGSQQRRRVFKAVAMRVSGHKPKSGRPEDEYHAAVRKALTRRKTRFDKTRTFKSKNFGYVETEGPDRTLAEVARKSQRGHLGGLHRDSTATVKHKTKPTKYRSSSIPRPVQAQKFDAGAAPKGGAVSQHPLNFRPQGKHKYGGGAMLGCSWPVPRSVTSTEITFTRCPVPYWKPSRVDMMARLEAAGHVLVAPESNVIEVDF
jgi:hypothetical protein